MVDQLNLGIVLEKNQIVTNDQLIGYCTGKNWCNCLLLRLNIY